MNYNEQKLMKGWVRSVKGNKVTFDLNDGRLIALYDSVRNCTCAVQFQRCDDIAVK